MNINCCIAIQLRARFNFNYEVKQAVFREEHFQIAKSEQLGRDLAQILEQY